ncbi:MAG: NADH:flavin oxidoreductase/NADH oxidase [Gammaproteobacteria bacterium]|nr:MAG: NADH:flavin oxidoreductase/NADH oxidase [Gammaproteobacteria bacterium]RLA09961.1 MAG: NADH:flavin oxidoreductase/NADH oxidase [Gammaproteobacteria bacterium]
MSNTTGQPLLFTPLTLRGVTAANRIVISPMCQYSANGGLPNQWHQQHISGLAAGGAGVVIMEASAVQDRGRITHGDLGIWSDAHGEALAPLAQIIRDSGSVPAIQLAHAGRKASMQRPWHGNGPLDQTDAARGELPWDIVAPSEVPTGDEFMVPHAMTVAQIDELVDDFAAATIRAHKAGFDLIEIHGGHGYLIHSFYSPLSNLRDDEYGGSRENRMRLPIRVAAAIRANWPDDKPLFFRVSGVDGAEGGWEVEDSVALAKELKKVGVDVIDCSSGGIAAATSPVARGLPRGPGFQVYIAEQVRREADIATQAVGLITDADQAEKILQDGDADLISIAREALYNPYWPRHAAQQLGADDAFSEWPHQYGWWLERRAIARAKIAK